MIEFAAFFDSGGGGGEARYVPRDIKAVPRHAQTTEIPEAPWSMAVYQ